LGLSSFVRVLVAQMSVNVFGFFLSFFFSVFSDVNLIFEGKIISKKIFGYDPFGFKELVLFFFVKNF
jgi:hypothetical protein